MRKLFFVSLVLSVAAVGLSDDPTPAPTTPYGSVIAGDHLRHETGAECGNRSCDNGPADCETITNRWTEWFPHGECVGTEEGDPVEQICDTWVVQCRHDIHYSGWFGNCTGTITDETWHNEEGC